MERKGKAYGRGIRVCEAGLQRSRGSNQCHGVEGYAVAKYVKNTSNRPTKSFRKLPHPPVAGSCSPGTGSLKQSASPPTMARGATPLLIVESTVQVSDTFAARPVPLLERSWLDWFCAQRKLVPVVLCGNQTTQSKRMKQEEAGWNLESCEEKVQLGVQLGVHAAAGAK